MTDEPTPPEDEPGPKPMQRGRRVPVGHEPHPEEVERLLEWTYSLPPGERYFALSDLEGLYWVACMRLQELRCMAVAELHDDQRFSYGQLAKHMGVTRGRVQQMVLKGRAARSGNMGKFPKRSQPDKLPQRDPADLILPADLRWRLRKAAGAKDVAVDTVALAAIQSYLEQLEQEWDQITATAEPEHPKKPKKRKADPQG